MHIQEETYKILGQRLLSSFDSKELVDWAVWLLENGHESESSIILAGLDSNSTEERERYFWQSISELKIDIVKTEVELIEYYAECIAEEVCKGNMKAANGLMIMQDVVSWTNYDSKYLQFFELAEDIDYLKNYGGIIYNSGLNKENIDHFIQEEFELFLEIKRLNIDEEIRQKSICNDCGQISKPGLTTKYQLKKPHKYQAWICSNCGSEKVYHFSTHKGKRKIIDRTKNNP